MTWIGKISCHKCGHGRTLWP